LERGMNYYPFNIGDYAAHTRGLSLIEDLAYRRIIDAYYQAEGPLTGDIARLIGMRDHPEAVAYVLATYLTETETGWVSKRCDEVIAEYHAKAETARSNGKKGGRPKKETQREPSGFGNETKRVSVETRSQPDSNPMATGSKANQEPITNKDQERMSPDKPTTHDARLAEVTDEAMTAYNATLAEPLSLPKAMPVGIDKKRGYVRRSLKTIREVCRAAYGSERISPEFWADYFAALAADDFIAGRTGRPKEHANWRPDFEYVTRPEVIAKAFERAAA
jgi:uncharacterized protein YdaU (DUF1376 family)